MPFESKRQSRACYATDGFGGAVDCQEWADKTDYKKLPEKKKQEKKAVDYSQPLLNAVLVKQAREAIKVAAGPPSPAVALNRALAPRTKSPANLQPALMQNLLQQAGSAGRPPVAPPPKVAPQPAAPLGPQRRRSLLRSPVERNLGLA